MASIGEVTATLRANTSQFSAGMNDAVAQLRQLGLAAGQATESERAFLIAQQQSIIAGLKKQGLVIINGRLVASETALAEATATATVAQQGFNQAAGGGMTGVSRLERSMASLITRATGLPQQLGSIGTSLLRIGTGGLVTLAVIAGIGLLVAAFDSLISKSREAAKQTKAALDELQSSFDARMGVDVANRQIAAQNALTEATKKYQDLLKTQAHPTRTVLGATGQAEQLTVVVTQQQIDEAKRAVEQAKQLVEQGIYEYRQFQSKQVATGSVPSVISAPKTPSVAPNDLAQQLIEARGQGYLDQMAQQKKALDDQFKQAEAVFREQDQFFRQQGQVLASSLTEGLVNGNLGQTLFDGLKRIFVSVLQRLLEDALINKLVKSLETLFNITQPQQSGGGGGGFLSALGTGIGTAIGGMLLSPGAPQVAAGGATALARGSASGVTVPLSGMPRALSPVEHARDAQWQYMFSETGRLLAQQGIKLGVS